MYVEDDNWITQKKRMLRFHHDWEYYFKPDDRDVLEQPLCYKIHTELKDGSVCLLVTGKKIKVYHGTSASLYHENGDLLCVVSTYLNPKDKFCRLIGRQVAQQKILACIGELNIPDYIKAPIISKINQNPKALPLDW